MNAFASADFSRVVRTEQQQSVILYKQNEPPRLLSPVIIDTDKCNMLIVLILSHLINSYMIYLLI